MMSRTQISLDPEQLRKARRRSSELGISLAEYVRRLIERDLDVVQEPVDRSSVFDLGDSGGSDIAKDKDSMLGEAVTSSRKPAHS